MSELMFLAHRIPFPPDRGDRIRSFHILRHLARLRPVHLLGFVDSEEDRKAAKELLPMLASLHIEIRDKSRLRAGIEALVLGEPVSLTAFGSRRIMRMVDQLLDERPIDTIFAYSGQMAQFVPDDRGGRRFIMDFVDVDSEKFAAYGASTRGLMGWVHRREARLLADYENGIGRWADINLFVSEAEAALFRQRAGLAAAHVRALDNGIDAAKFDPAGFPRVEGAEPLLVFTGQMDYRPNVDAVTWFARRTFRAIRAKHPNALFAIVGRDPTPAVRELAELKNVIVTGGVPDVRPWIAAAAVVVAPLDIARGVQNKVLEAMAMARPVVASPAAFEGIDAVPGEHLIVAQGNDMANAVGHLIAHPEEGDAMGRRARAHVIQRYDWERQLVALDAMIGQR
jgi:sugar transferase (PEP-CTERM/EpsH1 system associated)